MVQISNVLVGTVNFVALLASFPAIGLALWLRTHAATECARFLQLPLLLLGMSLFVVSVLGFVGSCFRVGGFLWAYVAIISLLIVGMFAFTAAALVVMNKSLGLRLSGKSFREYQMGDYTHWIHKRTFEWENWALVEGCLKEAHVCRGVLAGGGRLYKHSQLSPIQSGCCKPPMYCHFTLVNGTTATWEVPESGVDSLAVDCQAWSNDVDKLCYSCNSCKAGLVATVGNGTWKKVTIVNLVLLVFLIFTWTAGCYALINNRKNIYCAKNYHKDTSFQRLM